MSCPRRPKKSFLGFKYSQEHIFEARELTQHMVGHSTDFILYGRCKYCSQKRRSHFIERSTLIKMGFTDDQIDQAETKELGVWFREGEGIEWK